MHQMFPECPTPTLSRREPLSARVPARAACHELPGVSGTFSNPSGQPFRQLVAGYTLTTARRFMPQATQHGSHALHGIARTPNLHARGRVFHATRQSADTPAAAASTWTSLRVSPISPMTITVPRRWPKRGLGPSSARGTRFASGMSRATIHRGIADWSAVQPGTLPGQGWCDGRAAGGVTRRPESTRR